MTQKQAEEMIIKAGGDINIFWDWMRGQTVGVYEDGSSNYYDYDVERFIRYKCNPKNEPSCDFD